jgi:dihydroorotate dehydrogenase (NAD+) catalytic subunit
MDAAFYDPAKTYDQNFSDGPAVVTNGTPLPPNRQITKSQSFLGFDVNVPFGIPAGPLLNAAYCKAAFDYGFDVNHYKTQRSVPFPVNAFPNVLYVETDGDLTLEKAKKPLVGKTTTDKQITDISITNSFGNPSKGPEYWQNDMKKALTYAKEGQLLIGSVVGTIQEGFSQEDYYNDFALTARLANETGVPVIEVNLSCPNVANEGIICYNADADETICRRVKETIGNTPLLVKLGYFSADQDELLSTIITKIIPFIQGVAVINTIPAPVVDEDGNQALPGPNRLSSGICGASVKWAGLDMVKRLARIREKLHADFSVVGVGGVMTEKDYQEYKKAGADLVQSATGAMWNPNLAYEVWQSEQ